MTSGGFPKREKGLRAFWLLFLAGGLLLFVWTPVLAGEIVIRSGEQMDFARSYMIKGQYDRAVGEFERFIHFFPDDPEVEEARYLIGVCHLKQGHYKAAKEAFAGVMQADPKGPLAGKALLMIGESYYEQGLAGEGEIYFRQVIAEYPHLKDAALYRLGWGKLAQNNWLEASEAFQKVEQGSPFYDRAQGLALESLKGRDLPYKDPASAGVLAALLPGLGHAYLSRYKSAAVAFLLNGLFAWAAVESFHEDHDVLGGILTFLEIGWYSGNIYSAVNGAHKYNRKVQDDFRDSLKKDLNLHLFSSGRQGIGVALTFRF